VFCGIFHGGETKEANIKAIALVTVVGVTNE